MPGPKKHARRNRAPARAPAPHMHARRSTRVPLDEEWPRGRGESCPGAGPAPDGEWPNERHSGTSILATRALYTRVGASVRASGGPRHLEQSETLPPPPLYIWPRR